MKDMKIIIKEDPIFQQAHETFYKFTAIDEYLERYEARMKYERDKAQAISDSREQGREEGRDARNTEIAKSMKDRNFPLDQIADITGLGRDFIEKL